MFTPFARPFPLSLGLTLALVFVAPGCTSVNGEGVPEAGGSLGGATGTGTGSSGVLTPLKGAGSGSDDSGRLNMMLEVATVDLLPDSDDSDPAGEIPEDPTQPPQDPGCVSNKTFFVQEVWTPILAGDCISCHSIFGQASQSKFVLSDSYQTGFLDENLALLEKLASYSLNGVPTLLIKPMGGDGHGGGVRFVEGSTEYAAMSEMIERIANPEPCEDVVAEHLFKGVEVLDWEPTLRKARMVMTSRLPEDSELEYVATMGETGFDLALGQIMDESDFFRWLKEAYNEVFLTDTYEEGTAAVDLLSAADFPDKLWHMDCDPGAIPNCAIPEFAENAATYTNWSVAQDALELVVHVVRNDLPFTDILMADYIMVNPYSAKTFGATNVYFNNPLDPYEFRPAQLVLAGGSAGAPSAYPHAGVLTSPTWLNRFPTTATNVNRHRSRMVYRQFLATDLLKLAERPVDQATITAHNPTMNEVACATCHVVADPVAGAFQNWNGKGRYRPPEEGWHAEMRPPGFGVENISPEDTSQSLRWLATRLAGDHRFVTSTVHTMFKALIGIDPISPPTEPGASDYSLQLSVYLQQDEYFKEIGDVFAESNYNLKAIITELIKSPYFRARQAQDYDATMGGAGFSEVAHEVSLQQLGTSRLLTPEELDRKISAVAGIDWVDPDSGVNWLLGPYRIYYGGIDFGEASDRITEMNGTMANIAERMANEVSCRAVPTDFMRLPEERSLFPFVEFDYAPTEVHGFAVPEMDELIRLNLLHLHERLLNEVIDTESVEFHRSYDLFVSVLEDGRVMLDNGLAIEDLPMACQFGSMSDDGIDGVDSLVFDSGYTVRAWMAVVSYILADYRFLYH